MKPDNKCKRRNILKTEEVKIYDRQERNKYSMQERLLNIGYPEKPIEEAYSDCVSHLAW